MTNEQIKDYLKKYRIDSEESLAKHIEELKRNTKPNNEIIFPLVDLLLNEKSVLNSFFAENKIRVNFYKDDVVTVKDGFKDLQGVINYFLDSDFDTYFAYKGGQLISQDFKKVTRTIAPFFLDEADISYQSFEDGKFKDNTVTYTSTRHKAREEGSFHKEIIGDLEGINRLPSIYSLYDNQNYYASKALETLNNQSAERHNIMNSDENTKKHSIHLEEKDDVITNSSRGEKETMEYLQGVKETEGKVNYGELDFDYIDSMALRMSKNLEKYPPKNWQKKMDIEELAKSAIRHARKIL